MDHGDRTARGARLDPAQVRAVVFDCFGTLVPGTPLARRAGEAAAAAAILGVDPERFLALLHSTFTERATGRLGDGPGVLRALARRMGADPGPEALAAAARLRADQMRVDMEPRPDAVPALRALRAAGYRLGMVSDCGPEVPRLWPSLPLAAIVEVTVFSVEVGRRKPHPSLYWQVCSALGVEPRECLYVGDGDSHELTGAVRVGMTAVRLAADDPDAQALIHYDHDVEWHGPAIAALADVPRLLGVPAIGPPLGVGDAEPGPEPPAAVGQ